MTQKQFLKYLTLSLTMGCLATSAQNHTLLYQGRVQSEGQLFQGLGHFKFALVTTANLTEPATATATISGGFVTIITLENGGEGYVTAPAIEILGGGGTGAMASATIDGGSVTEILVTNPGAGYDSVPAVQIAPPPPTYEFTTYWSHDGTSVDGSEPATAIRVPVMDGLFQVALGDTTLANMSELPPEVFLRPNLQLRIWFDDGGQGFTALNPPQPLAAAPYAMAVEMGNISNPHFLGTTTEAPLVLSVDNTPALRLEKPDQSDGVVNIVGGHANNSINRISQGAVIAGGGSSSRPNTIGSTSDRSLIGAGAGNLIEVNSWDSVLAGGLDNSIQHSVRSFIGGGTKNSLNVSAWSVLAGGENNSVLSSRYSALAGGKDNLIETSDFGSIGGGSGNEIQISAHGSTISGGQGNLIDRDSEFGVIDGGRINGVGHHSPYSVIGGGQFNIIGTNNAHSTIAGGSENEIGDSASGSTIAGGRRHKIHEQSIASTVGGGSDNFIALVSDYTTIGGGRTNFIGPVADFATISGGYQNFVGTNAIGSTIGGGEENRTGTRATHATIAGGTLNIVASQSDSATIGGGSGNVIGEDSINGTIAGGSNNEIVNQSSSVTISGGVNNRVEKASDGSVIAGGISHEIGLNSPFNSISGGQDNEIGSITFHATIAGGQFNSIGASASGSSIGGGRNHSIGREASDATIAGGTNQRIEQGSRYGTISGGNGNLVASNSLYTAIGGGNQNAILVNSDSSTIAGGSLNTIGSQSGYATIPGGRDNEVNAFYGFAAGRRAKANHLGSFVWADSQTSDFSSTTLNEFNIRASGGVRIESAKGIHLNAADAPIITRDWDPFASTALNGKAGIGRWGLFMEPNRLTAGFPARAGKYFQVAKYTSTGTPTTLLEVDVDGNVTTLGAVNPTSDRNQKQDFENVDPQEMLDKVAAMPIQTWAYKESPETRHIGPVAQDFHDAFALGIDDKHIATVDADGVALAAIQGLNAKVENNLRDTEHSVASLQRENEQLRLELQAIKELLRKMAHPQTQGAE